MPNFRIGESLIFETNRVKISEKLENNFYLENNWMMKKNHEKLKAEAFRMSGAHHNTVILVDRFSVSIIHHLRHYFLFWLVQNNLKSKINTEYI